MNRSILRSAAALLSLFVVLAVAVTYQQAIAGPRYRDDLRNRRTVDARAAEERGAILTADGEVVARSVPGADPGSHRRDYPWGETYAHVVGYSSPLFGDTGIEAAQAQWLRSPDYGGPADLIRSILDDGSPHSIRLSVRHDLQTVAAAALGDQRGAIVALDPATGAVLAMVSSPSFDPDLLLDPYDTAVGDALSADPARPLLNRGIAEVYPPGSVFKVITAAAALQHGYAETGTLLPDAEELLLPGTSTPIRNAAGGFCADGESLTLEQAMAVSCNTAFAALGTAVGAALLAQTAEEAGFNDSPPFPFDVAESRFPPAADLEADLPALAQTAIGGRDVRTTALHMALMAGAIGNDGIMMRPYLVDEIVDAEGQTVHTADPREWRAAFPPDTAVALRGMMEQVVAGGTGRAASVSGLTVAGKTGTADSPTGAPTVWFVATAHLDSNPTAPQIALAVVIESGGELGEEGSGGRVAAPAAAGLLEAWLNAAS